MSDPLHELLRRYVEHHVRTGERLPLDELCPDDPELRARLAPAVERYERLDAELDEGPHGPPPPRALGPDELPRFEGFRTVERLGRGGMGTVYKLEDLQLGRTVAAKVIHGGALNPSLDGFLREAASLALFSDPRIVQIHEFRPDADPPAIIMEYVDGFELGAMAPSLEWAQRARVLLEVAEAIHRAHGLGLQHRDLKPSNIMLDPQLQPKILDFGLAGGDPSRGHGVGTPPYLAPEQLDPERPIDARTDVYALGVIFYEVLCGATPFAVDDDAPLLEQIRRGPARLPREVDPDVPEPLQAIALQAMEVDPGDRYPSAAEMARDLRRYLAGRPVLARPTAYATALGRRMVPHLQQLEEWRRLRLIHPHEADRLRAEYRRLEARDDDWIVGARRLSMSQIALYLGAFLVAVGSLLYFLAHRVFDAVSSVLGPLIVLGLPFAGLNIAARALFLQGRRAVATAFYLGAVVLLPLLLLIVLGAASLWGADPGDPTQLLGGGASNCQLQVAVGAAMIWSGLLAVDTRTSALSTACVTLTVLFALTCLTPLGLRGWLEQGRWDLLALHLAPLVPVFAPLGRIAEQQRARWAATPLYVAAAVLLVACLELVALKGRAMALLGLSLAGLQGGEVPDPTLLDTLSVMTVNGALLYGVGTLVERHGTAAMQPAAWLLFTLTPFAVLEPIGYLVSTGAYLPLYDWAFLALSLAVAVLSYHRQRLTFYLAGLANAGVALVLIARNREWFDAPWWATAIVVVGLGVLGLGLALDLRERARRE